MSEFLDAIRRERLLEKAMAPHFRGALRNAIKEGWRDLPQAVKEYPDLAAVVIGGAWASQYGWMALAFLGRDPVLATTSLTALFGGFIHHHVNGDEECIRYVRNLTGGIAAYGIGEYAQVLQHGVPTTWEHIGEIATILFFSAAAAFYQSQMPKTHKPASGYA